MGNPLAVRVGPGKLYIAPLATSEPSDLVTPWNVAWTALGYTDEGSEFVFNQTFENVLVAEELDPVQVLQTARELTINFALAEITAQNMSRAMNGGEVLTPGGLVTFEPPSVGDFTYMMLGWEADDELERWVFRRCLNVGSVNIPRRRAPAKALIPMSFRAIKPPSDATFLFIHDADFVQDES